MKEHRPLGWTTLEEAKLLVDSGLDPNTADMMYIATMPFLKEFDNERKVYLRADKIKEKGRWFRHCWSLGALIDLMPKEIRLNYLYTLNIFTTYGNKHCVSYHSICENIYAESEPTLIESVVRCVFWLLENNHIKKSE